MGKEVEVKLVYDDKAAVEDRLRALGATQQPRVTLCDQYYRIDGTGMSNTNALLRIRREDEQHTLTYKGECEDENGVWTREEITVGITDDTGMARILAAFGATIIRENASIREPWILGDGEIVFIEFTKPVPLFLIEIEAHDAATVEEVLNGLGDTVTRAGEELFAPFDTAAR